LTSILFINESEKWMESEVYQLQCEHWIVNEDKTRPFATQQ